MSGLIDILSAPKSLTNFWLNYKKMQEINATGYKLDAVTRLSMFGHEDAGQEKAERLKQYFVKKTDYETVTSDVPLSIVIGFKGVGKSATLKVAYEEDRESNSPAMWIRPDDVSELYNQINAEENTLNLITLWKKGIARLVACKIAEDWTITASSDAEHVLTWAESSGYKSKDLISQLASRFTAVIKGDSEISVKDIREKDSESLGEHHILKRISEKKTIRIYIDDLDRGWEATELDKKRLAALIYALGDLTSDIEGFQARISLRTDVYSLIRSTKEFTDKFESAEVWCIWNNANILKALIKRIYSHFKIEVQESDFANKSQAEIAKLLQPIFKLNFENTKSWSGKPTYRVLMSLIRRRPRDLVKLVSMAAKYAHEDGRNVVTGDDFCEIMDDYSSGRMTDIINEFSSEMNKIGDLLYNMGPTVEEIKKKQERRYTYSTQELYDKIKNATSNVSQVRLANARATDHHDIAQFLYKIGFVTGRKDLPNKIDRVYFEQKKQLLGRQVGDKGYSWEIHPAYRSALFVKTKNDSNWESTVDTSQDED